MAKTAISKLITFVFSFIFLFFSAIFLWRTFLSSLHNFDFYWPLLIFFISLLVVAGVRTEYRKMTWSNVGVLENLNRFQYIQSFFIIGLNTLITHFLMASFDVSAVFAASLVCLVSTWLFPEHEAEAFSGSVAGMMGSYLYTSWQVGLLTSLVTGMIFFLFLPFFKGIGGRGGAVSFIGTLLTVQLLLALKPGQQSLLTTELQVLSFFVILAAALISYFLHEKKILSIVRSSMLTAFMFSVLLPAEFSPVIAAAFSGAVVGMSDENRVADYTHLFMVAAVNFILFVPSYPLWDGIGGKAGLISLLSYFASTGLKNISFYFKKNSAFKQKDSPNQIER